jgi:hypothetical protein
MINNNMINNNMMNNIIPNVQNMPNIVNNNIKTPMNYKQNMPLPQNYNNRVYNNINSINNINNNLINQNSINIINNNIDYINTKNKPSPRSYINNNNTNINLHMKPMPIKVKCTCSKTGCKKKYCACFSLGRFCEDCECKDCENKGPTEDNNNSPNNNQLLKQESLEKNLNYSKTDVSNSKNQRVICNCTKSNCMKKYCECFKQGLICNSLCRCRECNNNNSCINDYNNVNNNIIKNNENRNINIKNDNNHFGPEYIEYNYNPINFQPEAFGISIKKEKLKVYERKINLNTVNSMNVNKNIIKEGEISTYNRFNETPKYSSRKRARSKIDISNMKTCPTSNSSNRRKKGLSNVNKNIQKKKLQLN